MDKEVRALKKDLLSLCWYMRGGLQYADALDLSYEERMILTYGNCERASYGFLKKAYELTKSANLYVINFEDYLWPSINNLFIKIDNDVDKRFFVLLNFKDFKFLFASLIIKE